MTSVDTTVAAINESVAPFNWKSQTKGTMVPKLTANDSKPPTSVALKFRNATMSVLRKVAKDMVTELTMSKGIKYM